jgi:hypothetical protein
MNIGSVITGIGTMIILVYGLTRILEFYGVGIDKYGSYMAFYIFLFISSYIIPIKYKNL